MIVWIAREAGGELYPVHKRFGTSDEFRAALREVNGLSVILDYEDGTTNTMCYVSGEETTWTGINVGDKLPDSAIENAIADVLVSKLGIDNPVFAWEIDKAEELTAQTNESALQRPGQS